MKDAPNKGDDLFKQIASGAGERSSLLTLSGGSDADTPISLARRLGDEGDPGIETLVVGLGSNNILGTVLNFQINWSHAGDPPAYKDLTKK